MAVPQKGRWRGGITHTSREDWAAVYTPTVTAVCSGIGLRRVASDVSSDTDCGHLINVTGRWQCYAAELIVPLSSL